MRSIRHTLLATAALLAIGARGADAQTIGFKLGASLANLNTDAFATTTSSITGFTGGGFIRFDFGRLGIQPELLSVTKGGVIDAAGVETEIRLEYIEVPLLLHIPLVLGTTVAPYVLGGAAIGFEIDCSAESGPSSFDCDTLAIGLASRKSTDFGVTAGVGLGFAAGPGAVLLEGRYTWGLTNINESGDANVRNRAGYITGGYSIPLGRRF